MHIVASEDFQRNAIYPLDMLEMRPQKAGRDRKSGLSARSGTASVGGLFEIRTRRFPMSPGAPKNYLSARSRLAQSRFRKNAIDATRQQIATGAYRTTT
jgi:hypothetical protein